MHPLPQVAVKCKPNSQQQKDKQEDEILEERQRQCPNICSGIEAEAFQDSTATKETKQKKQCHFLTENTAMIVSSNSESEISECKLSSAGKSPRTHSLKSNTTDESLSSTPHLIQQRACQSSSIGQSVVQTGARPLPLPTCTLKDVKLKSAYNSQQQMIDEHETNIYESIPVNTPTNTVQQEGELSGSSVNLQKVDPPLLPVHRQKTNSWKQMNEQDDITIHESMYYITTNPSTNSTYYESYYESDPNPILHTQQEEDELSISNSSRVNQKENAPPLPVRRLKATKPEPHPQQTQMSEQDPEMYESVYYDVGVTNFGIDSSPLHLHSFQGADSEVRSSNEDPPPLPISQVKAMKAESISTLNEHDIKMYESVCYNMGENPGTSTAENESPSMQQTEHELSGRSVNPHKDSPGFPPVCSQHGGEEACPHK